MIVNIYFCHRKYEPDAGLFVAAQTRGRAKALFAAETGEQYTKVCSQIAKREVYSDWPHVINRGSADLEWYGLEYEEEP